MNYEYFKFAGSQPVKAWVKGVPLEESALNQIENISKMPFIHHHVAVMPDAHHGNGSTVGTVFGTVGALIPAAVGVDIGCGMMACRTTLKASDLPDNLNAVRSAIEAAVPHGRTDNGQRNDKGRHQGELPREAKEAMAALETGLKVITSKHTRLEKPASTCWGHMGTLGTGNHFIEVCLDEDQNVWLMLHSGSRGIGNGIGTYFIEAAKKDMRKWHINLPDQDLAYIPEGTENFLDYVYAVNWAQDFAMFNRHCMMVEVVRAIEDVLDRRIGTNEKAINCHHNYVQKENHFHKNVWLTRKGAVSAREGQLGIIPGSMGAKSFIVRGKGNPDSFCSCSHGAGRKMSRTQARKSFSVEDHIRATAGVECRKDSEVVDETPMAYKDIEAVMEAQKDLVEIVHTLKQVVCVKG